MNVLLWIQIFISLSVIASIKELMYSREGNERYALAYSISAAILMFIAIYLAWKGT